MPRNRGIYCSTLLPAKETVDSTLCKSNPPAYRGHTECGGRDPRQADCDALVCGH